MADNIDLDEFDPYRATDRGVLIYLLPVLIALVVESAAIFLLESKQINFSTEVIVHIAVVIFLIGVAVVYNWLLWDLRFPLLSLAVITVLAPFGSILIITSIIFYLMAAGRIMEFGKWINALFPPDPTSKEITIYERIIADWDDFSDKIKLTPFADIMAFGNVNEKVAVLMKIATNFDPRFAELLKKSLNDPAISVRVQAASIFAKFENKYSSNHSRLQKILDRTPRNTEAILELARLCDQSSLMGIFDEGRAAKMRARAIELYQKYLEIAGVASEVDFELGWLYTRQGDPVQGKKLLEAAVVKNPHSAEIVHSFLVSLYQCKDYAELRRYAQMYYAGAQQPEMANSGVLEELLLWKDGMIL